MKNTKAGFSLVEVMVAIMLIAVATVSALGFYIYCNRLSQQTEARVMAANFARETMEKFYKKSYAELPLTAETADQLPAGELKDLHSGSRKYTITDGTGANGADYRLITVTVTWTK